MNYFTKFILIIVCIVPISLTKIKADIEEIVVAPISSLGEFSDVKKEILFNRLITKLSERYRIVPKDKFLKAQEQAFQELDYNQCTEVQCIQ